MHTLECTYERFMVDNGQSVTLLKTFLYPRSTEFSFVCEQICSFLFGIFIAIFCRRRCGVIQPTTISP
eukprot:TRINITY_DN1397_c0_g1_i3.p4 TRINITY_DN1397_c0_g1~~TRINITY_DN1397_c0_g1_i3.p4  ORF type:complete len:68 (+),score=8.24 TRINITY_DN1397_c0_g1_i3:661-864(+)